MVAAAVLVLPVFNLQKPSVQKWSSLLAMKRKVTTVCSLALMRSSTIKKRILKKNLPTKALT